MWSPSPVTGWLSHSWAADRPATAGRPIARWAAVVIGVYLTINGIVGLS